MVYLFLSAVFIGLSFFAMLSGMIELAQYTLLLLISAVVTLHVVSYWRNRK